MSFYASRMPAQSPTSLKNQLLLPIGRHAFVHLPSAGASDGDFIPFGRTPDPKLARDPRDGEEVEIIAWRPSAPQGLAYQIHRLSDRREWWAKATCLRKSASAARVEQ